MNYLARAACLVFLFILLVPNEGSAEISIDDYKTMKNPEQIKQIKIYIQGVGMGISWANVVMRQDGREPLYCPPEKMSFRVQNYIDIIDQQIMLVEEKLNGKVPDNAIYIELLLLNGLIHTFPCK